MKGRMVIIKGAGGSFLSLFKSFFLCMVELFGEYPLITKYS